MPYMDKARGKWRAKVKKGSTVRTALFRTRREALDWEADQRSADWSRRTGTVSLAEWAVEYLDWASLRFVATTMRNKRRAFKRLFQAMDKEMKVDKVTARDFQKFFDGLIKVHGPHSVNHDIKNLRSAWRWGAKFMENFPNPGPMVWIEHYPTEERIQYTPPLEDFWQVYDVATNDQRTMLLAYLHTGARREELRRLKWEDVNFMERSITLFTRKRRGGSLEADKRPMSDDLHDALVQHRQRFHGELVFPADKAVPLVRSPETLAKLCKRAGVRRFGFHGIRRLTASILAGEGIPMVDIQYVLRHRNLRTTERYVQRLDSRRPLLAVLPGRGGAHSGAHKAPAKLKVVD